MSNLSPNGVPPKVKPGYTNPAFRAMGIPPLKLPSRNWMIFWSVVTVSVSGILYDKQKQKQIRNHYQDIVKPLANEPIDVNLRPRKITVFIAPPPNDYLDSSLKIWRRYIKPILYYAGVDYEIVQEEKQGMIRTEVANRVRAVRRQLLEARNQEKPLSHEGTSKNEFIPLDEYDPEQAKRFKANFDYRNVIGPFLGKDKPVVTEADSLTPSELSGGVICLGRGAYKEYITGLHEGLLGPLEAPVKVRVANADDKQSSQIQSAETNVACETITESQSEEPNVGADSNANEDEKHSEEEHSEEKQSEKDSKSKISKPFITPADYANVEIPHELSLSGQSSVVRDPKTNIPLLLHQPVLAISVPNLVGFLKIPERIYRFYRKRYYCEEVCSAVTDLVVQKNIRPFSHPQDLGLAIEEEDDWPKSWVKEGLKRQSEWTSDLKDDPRIVEYVTLYNEKKEE
ncbi:hypothetical protein HG535_0C04860 [Zygotorulaspora mrakii]|uniref:Mitochondrial import inner membrane translocase subunit TIM54 n=1 Tax=Zygotorulaspora mrakii TaxID=42260 RepID=A0A7H9B2Z1_ZYGMR|nr:uncharacterized protein HG535_0C04860 [Zygotorulaspora mrakii]QLG72132.1 hypothetical protein HG535_0C04860 [Zygotorulaspora mrakii]